MNSQVQIITPRLILKGITPAIIHQLFNSQLKEEIVDYFAVDDAGYQRMLNMHEMGMETNRYSLFFFLICDRENNFPLGECGFHTLNQTHRRAELFYQLRKDEHKRKGFITEALPRVLQYGYLDLNLHRIEALVGSQNIPSVKLMQRFRFTKEGTMREDFVIDGKSVDSDCYSLLKWEWEEMQDNKRPRTPVG
jgi:ribosomal-protein-alanine N-acetyltransferase